MALQMTITTKSNLTVNNAYIKIHEQRGNNQNINLIVRSFVSREAMDDGVLSIEESFYSFIPNVADGAQNFIKQGYEYLKTLSKYESAVDVLEEGQTA